MATITLMQWAELHEIPYSTATYWVRNGIIKATKPGRDWLIDSNTKPPKTYTPKGSREQEAITI